MDFHAICDTVELLRPRLWSSHRTVAEARHPSNEQLTGLSQSDGPSCVKTLAGRQHLNLEG